MKIQKMESPNSTPRTPGTSVKKIVLMASLMKDADEQAAELMNPKRQRSFHYVIGCDGKVIQVVPEESRAWSVRLREVDEPSVSICYCTENIPFCDITRETWDAIVTLTADLCKRYNIVPYFSEFLNKGTIIPYFVGGYMKSHKKAFIEDVCVAMEKVTKKKGGTKK